MAAPSFSFTPSQDTLLGLKRDLRFRPSPVNHPRSLTRDQVAHYNAHGYVLPLEVFSATEAAGVRSYFDELLARVLASGGNSYSISTAHMRYGPVYDILTNRRIVAYVSDLLGNDVVAWGSHFFCKMPGDGKTVAWHQDASYWPLNPSNTVTVWLAIDDADVENACMRFIPNTHTLGHLTYRITENTDPNVLNQEVPDVEQYGNPVDVVLKAGQCSIHADLLLHGSNANNSNRRRCGLTLRYSSADVRAYEGWNAKGIVVSGSDPTGHWGNPPRPSES